VTLSLYIIRFLFARDKGVVFCARSFFFVFFPGMQLCPPNRNVSGWPLYEKLGKDHGQANVHGDCFFPAFFSGFPQFHPGANCRDDRALDDLVLIRFFSPRSVRTSLIPLRYYATPGRYNLNAVHATDTSPPLIVHISHGSFHTVASSFACRMTNPVFRISSYAGCFLGAPLVPSPAIWAALGVLWRKEHALFWSWVPISNLVPESWLSPPDARLKGIWRALYNLVDGRLLLYRFFSVFLLEFVRS